MNMKRIFAINLILVFAIASLSFGGSARIADDERPDIPSFVGYAPNRIVVKFDPSTIRMMDKGTFQHGKTGIPAFDHVGTRLGVKSVRPQFPGAQRKIYKGKAIDLAGWHKIKFSGKVDVMAAVKEYKAMPGVIDAQPVSIHTVYQEPNDEFYDIQHNIEGISQWHLPKIKAPEAWNIETGDPDIIVAILDTGVRYFQKDLGGDGTDIDNILAANGNMWINPGETGLDADSHDKRTNSLDDDGNGYVDDWIGWDFVETTYDSVFLYCYPEDFLLLGEEGEDCGVEDNDPRDFNGHGTHCAGNVSAMNNNDEAVASVAGGWGNGSLEQSGNGVKVMSLRIGWSAIYFGLVEVGVVSMDYAAEALYYAANNGARIASSSWGSENTGGIEDAINYFLASGGLIFKAAGNDSSETADYLASREDVITVAATDQNDCKAYFSSYGTWVDISAPGVEIWSLFHFHYDPPQDYVTAMDGTSMSTPLAAGVAALIWSKNPSLSAEQVKQTLYDTADEIDLLDCNSGYAGKLGAGRINAFNAVNVTPEPSPVEDVAVETLEIGKYETTGKGKRKTTTFVNTDTFNRGDEVVIRVQVQDGGSNPLVPNATVDIAVTTGSETISLTTEPSDSNGMAEAKWKTSAPKGKRKRFAAGTTLGPYTATVTNVTADGYSWDGTQVTDTFTIQ